MGEDEFNDQLRKAFQELHAQILDSKERQKNVENTKSAMKQNIKIANIVKSQLEIMPRDRIVYKTVGRIFVSGTVDSEIDRQEKDIKQCKERIGILDKQIEYINKGVLEKEKSLRDFVQKRPA